jgi:hypothetical protein
MNFNFDQYLPADFHANSRVWIYQSSRLFLMSEALEIEPMLEAFLNSWNTHGTPVKGFANLLYGQFIVFMADETVAGVSGCSTDSSVRLIKEIEKKFKVDLFNRQNLAFVVKDKIQLLPLAQLQYGFDNGFLNQDTIYFNNLVANKGEMMEKWLIPVKDSWLITRIKQSVS